MQLTLSPIASLPGLAPPSPEGGGGGDAFAPLIEMLGGGGGDVIRPVCTMPASGGGGLPPGGGSLPVLPLVLPAPPVGETPLPLDAAPARFSPAATVIAAAAGASLLPSPDPTGEPAPPPSPPLPPIQADPARPILVGRPVRQRPAAAPRDADPAPAKATDNEATLPETADMVDRSAPATADTPPPPATMALPDLGLSPASDPKQPVSHASAEQVPAAPSTPVTSAAPSRGPVAATRDAPSAQAAVEPASRFVAPAGQRAPAPLLAASASAFTSLRADGGGVPAQGRSDAAEPLVLAPATLDRPATIVSTPADATAANHAGLPAMPGERTAPEAAVSGRPGDQSATAATAGPSAPGPSSTANAPITPLPHHPATFAAGRAGRDGPAPIGRAIGDPPAALPPVASPMPAGQPAQGGAVERPALAAAIAAPATAPVTGRPEVRGDAVPLEPTAAADRGRSAAVAEQPVPAPRAETPAILPALQAFGAAMRRAVAEERRPARPEPDAATLTPLVGATAAVAVPPAAADATVDLGDRRWPHAMAAQIERLRDAADEQSTRIRLLPDALGPVDVAVRRDGEQVHVHFTATQAETRQLLADAQPRLAEAAEARGLKLGRADVSGGDLTGDRQQPQQRQSAPQPSRPAPARARVAATADPTDTRIA